jgi:hypothetical protein
MQSQSDTHVLKKRNQMKKLVPVVGSAAYALNNYGAGDYAITKTEARYNGFTEIRRPTYLRHHGSVRGSGTAGDRRDSMLRSQVKATPSAPQKSSIRIVDFGNSRKSQLIHDQHMGSPRYLSPGIFGSISYFLIQNNALKMNLIANSAKSTSWD